MTNNKIMNKLSTEDFQGTGPYLILFRDNYASVRLVELLERAGTQAGMPVRGWRVGIIFPLGGSGPYEQEAIRLIQDRINDMRQPGMQVLAVGAATIRTMEEWGWDFIGLQHPYAD